MSQVAGSFQFGAVAARQESAGPSWRCPWCGNDTWIVSQSDIGTDHGRLEMYCRSERCASRETILIIRRGDRADQRKDVLALQALDEGRLTVTPEPDTYRPLRFNLDFSGEKEALRRKREGDEPPYVLIS
jgi:hypothetical protein